MSDASLSLPARVAQRPAKLCSDAQLAQRAARRDERAFAEVFERHHQALYRYCRSILGSSEDAADALQSTMAAVLHGLGGETRQIALKPWLFRIAHNEALSILRRRRPQSELDEATACPRASVEAEVLQSEQLRQMVDDVRALPDRQRSALVLRELNDLDYSEIAAVFGIAEGAARQAVHEARTMLGELSAGRAIPCADIRELISARDGRVMRGRKVRSHLRACPTCEGFHAAIGQRRAGLAAVAPPLGGPLAASILNGLLAGGSAGGAAGTSLAAGAGAGATVAGSGAAVAESVGMAALTAKMTGGAGVVAKSLVAFGATATVAGGTIVIEQRLHSAEPDAARQVAPAPAASGPGQLGGREAAAGAPGVSSAQRESAAGAAVGVDAGASQADAQSPGGSEAATDSPLEPVTSQADSVPSVAGDLTGEPPSATVGDESATGGATDDIEIVDEGGSPASGLDDVIGSPDAGVQDDPTPGASVPPVAVPNTGVGVDPTAPLENVPQVSVP